MPDRATRSTRGWREIHRYAYMQRPYEDVWFWLAGYLRTIGVPLPGGGRSVELRVRPGGVDLHRPVRLHLAGLVCDTGRASVGLSWVDAAHPHLFPELDGVLELTPVPNKARPFTQLGVVARYRPPFGPLGAVGDRLVGAEVADAALTAFIDEVAQTAEAYLEPPPALVPDGDQRDGTEPSSDPEEGGVRRIFLTIDGLAVRPGGAAGVGAALAATPGVVTVTLDPWAGIAAVDYDPDRCRPDRLVRAAEDPAATGAAV